MIATTIDVRGWIRVTWLVVAFVVGGIGIGCIWWPAAQDISQRHARAMELYEEANTIDAAIRRASQLRSAQFRIKTDLAELGGVRSPGAITAALLQLLHEESKRQGVEVREVAPDTNPHTSPPPRTPQSSILKADVLAPEDIAVSVRGPFRNIVALVADLPRHDVLVDIRDIQLSSTEAARRPPILDVTLHATIYHLMSLPTVEISSERLIR